MKNVSELIQKQLCPHCGSDKKNDIWKPDENKNVYSVLCSTCGQIYRIDIDKMKIYK